MITINSTCLQQRFLKLFFNEDEWLFLFNLGLLGYFACLWKPLSSKRSRDSNQWCIEALHLILSPVKPQLKGHEQVFGLRPSCLPPVVNNFLSPDYDSFYFLTLLSQVTLISSLLTVFVVETEVKIAPQPSTFQRVWMILPSPQRSPASDIDICVLFMSVPCYSQWVLSAGTVQPCSWYCTIWGDWRPNTLTAWWLLSSQGLKNWLYPKTNTSDKRRAMKPDASSCRCLSSETLHPALHGICLVI